LPNSRVATRAKFTCGVLKKGYSHNNKHANVSREKTESSTASSMIAVQKQPGKSPLDFAGFDSITLSAEKPR
jgi:hypothetical protein